MRVLVMHGIPESSVHYAENIDHHAHQVTYVTTAQKVRTLPVGVPLRVVERSGTGDTAAEVLAAVEGLPAPDLVISTSELDVIPAAQVREALGVPGATVRDVLPVRDKVVMKTAVEAAGVRVPRFMPLPAALAGGEGAVPWQGRTVLKPLAGQGSDGTHVFPSVAAALAAVRGGTLSIDVDGFEVEQFVSGRIMHVDGLLVAGRPAVVLAGRYVGTCLAYAAGSPVGTVQIDTSADLTAWTSRCLRAVGIENGPFHLEAIETPEGPVFLEVGARSGGRFIMDTFELATGIRLPGLAVRLAVEGPAGLPGPRDPSPDRLYGAFLFPGHALGSGYCRITGEEAFRDDPMVLRWHRQQADAPLSRQLTYSPGRVALAGTLGPAPTAVLEDFMVKLFDSVRVTPGEDPPGG
ncbi:ATP-grasp domain-containing protein [Streptomyces olindensis]|uniref:ATP-grasp domain-containing protein n=1 Tax=Streptomyces olindensis TaxID=358823 RepID=UPI0033DCAF9B